MTGPRAAAPQTGGNAQAAPSPSPARVLLVAAFLGLAAAFMELAIVMGAVRFGPQVRLSEHYVWMIPAAHLCLFLTAAVALLLAGRAVPRLSGRAIVGGALVGLGALCVLLLLERIHDLALVMLAAGIGSVAGRHVDGAPARVVRRVAAPGAVVLAALALFLGASMARTLAAGEARARSALPAPTGGLNVVLLILDTVRQTSTSLHPGGPGTPSISELGARGVVYGRALATAPWTLPSHGSMFTGRWAHELSTSWTAPLDRTHPTLAEALAERGWETAGFVGNILFGTRATGLARGFVLWQDYPVSVGQAVLSTAWGRALGGATLPRRVVGYHDTLNRRKARVVGDGFLGWLDRRDGSRPFFAFVNLFDAHEPTFPPGLPGSVLWPGPRWTRFVHSAGLFAGANAWYEAKWELSPGELEVYVAGYEAAVRRADAEVGRIVGELEARGLLESTLLVVTSDHGEQLGERGLFQHDNSLYLPALHVPLLIVDPLRRLSGRVETVVSLRDLPATVLALLDLVDDRFPGSALPGAGPPGGERAPALSFLEQDRVERSAYPVARGPTMFGLTTDRWHYVRYADGSEELFDWEGDPEEAASLIGTAADSAAARLRTELGRLLRESP